MSAGPPLVKICGLMRREDAAVAAAAGAAYGGVILAPGHARSVTAERAASLLEGLPLRRVGVFVDAAPDVVASEAAAAALQVVQLHGDESPEDVEALRGLGDWSIWKAVRPRSARELLAGIDRYSGLVDGILLEGWSSAGRGGTGAAFDWEAAAAHRGRLPDGVDLVVAGGLRPENVGRAVELLRPDVVDVSSGVEAERGIKDPGRIRAFIAASGGRVNSSMSD